MKYCFATPEDLPEWMEVANDVGEIMRVTDLSTNADFLEYAKRKLEQNDAIIAYDDSNEKCAGFIGFSRHNNSITWLGVKSKYRNKGIGSGLLVSALNELDRSKRITVNTYPDNYLPGQPARSLYFKHGFAETDGKIFLFGGLEMVELSIIPNTEL